MTKICTKCKIEQSTDSFNKQRGSSDGLRSNCKKCISESYYKNKELKGGYICISLSSLKVCNKCNVEQSVNCFSKRWDTKDGYQPSCKMCVNEYHKQFYLSNKEVAQKYYKKNKKKAKQWRKENKETISIKQKQWYDENKDKIKLNSKQYIQTPMGKAVSINKSHKRRSLAKQGDVTSKQLLQLRQGTTHCFWCNIPLKDIKPHIDHVTPLSKGGEHSLYNLVVSCPTCNIRKGAKDPLEFAKIIFNEEIK